MKTLTVDDLPVLNLILARDPELAQLLEPRLAALEAVLARLPTVPSPAHVEVPHDAPALSTAQSRDEFPLEDRILDWFRMHPGKHKLSEVRADLKVAPESKPFKTALRKLINAKKVKSTGARGRGAEYWLG